jgi:hypothetical protein
MLAEDTDPVNIHVMIRTFIAAVLLAVAKDGRWQVLSVDRLLKRLDGIEQHERAV